MKMLKNAIDGNENQENECEEYVPIDLCAVYDVTDSPPPGLFDDDDFRLPNPFSETILRKIGNTWYSIRTSCDGSESLSDKVKRLIFNDPMSKSSGKTRKVVLQG